MCMPFFSLVVEYYILSGSIWILLWGRLRRLEQAVCLGYCLELDEGSKPVRTRCFIAVAPCLSLPSLSLLLFLLLLLLLLHIPAVCLSALSQRWCETWRQGAWAASFCQLTLWPPALPPQLHVPMPQQGTTGHLYWVDSRCQQKSFHVVWVILNSTELVEESTSIS